jgi:3-mercaptopyruvate sulfurtransferase SseA
MILRKMLWAEGFRAMVERTLRVWVVLGLGVPGLGVVAMTGCETVSDRTVRYWDVAQARKAWLESLKEPTELLVVDPRPAEQYRTAHIPGAVSLAIPQVRDGTLRVQTAGGSRLAKEYETILVYGSDPGSGVALAMAKRMLTLGFEDVYVLRGGLIAWRTQGGEVDDDGAARAQTEASAPGAGASEARP